MPYATFTRSPGMSMQQVRAISAALGDDRPDGLLYALVGEADGAVLAVEVWATQADADRFVAERLHPAFQQVGVMPDDLTTVFGFEAADVNRALSPAVLS